MVHGVVVPGGGVVPGVWGWYRVVRTLVVPRGTGPGVLFGRVFPVLTLFGRVFPVLSLFGPVLATFGPIWPYFSHIWPYFSHIWPYLALFGPIWPSIGLTVSQYWLHSGPVLASQWPSVGQTESPVVARQSPRWWPERSWWCQARA